MIAPKELVLPKFEAVDLLVRLVYRNYGVFVNKCEKLVRLTFSESNSRNSVGVQAMSLSFRVDELGNMYVLSLSSNHPPSPSSTLPQPASSREFTLCRDP